MGYKINGDSETVQQPVYQYLPSVFTASTYTMVNYLDGSNSTNYLRKVVGYWRTSTSNRLFRIRNMYGDHYEHSIVTTSASNPTTANLDEPNLVPSESARYTVRCVRR